MSALNVQSIQSQGPVESREKTIAFLLYPGLTAFDLVGHSRSSRAWRKCIPRFARWSWASV
jgi:hypothetical protein